MMESDGRNRGMVISIPKAGTYFTVQLLKAMGVKMSHLHLRYDDQGSGVYDFRNAPEKMSMSEQEACFMPMNLEASLSMVKGGEFAVGHLPPLPEVKTKLCGAFKLIFQVRNLRDCLISHMRYMIKIGGITVQEHPWCEIADERERFKQYLWHYADKVGPLVHMKLIASWEYDIHDPYPGMELFKLRFEDLVCRDRRVAVSSVNALANFLGLELPSSAESLLDCVLAQDTLTRSDGLTVRERYWSPFAEQWFAERICDIQGSDINKMIGYA